MKTKKILLTLIVTLFLLTPIASFADAPITAKQGCKAGDNEICLNVPITPDTNKPLPAGEALGTYISAWYSFIIGTVGILATVMIMIAGFKWLTSAGDSGKIGDAKDMMFSAITGLVLAFLSYTILYIVNPNLTIIHLDDLESRGVKTSEETPSNFNGTYEESVLDDQIWENLLGIDPNASEGTREWDFVNVSATDYLPGGNFRESVHMERIPDGGYIASWEGITYEEAHIFLNALQQLEPDINWNVSSLGSMYEPTGLVLTPHIN